MKALKNYITRTQAEVLEYNTKNGEEKNYFIKLIDKMETKIETIPELYRTEEEGNDSMIGLHYFLGGSDWYVTELDKEERILFGYVILNEDTEMSEFGYISLNELLGIQDVELDFHWEEITIGEMKKREGIR